MFFTITFCLIFILGLLTGAYLLYLLAMDVPTFEEQNQNFKIFIQTNPDLFKNFTQISVPRYDPKVSHYLFYSIKPGENEWQFDATVTEKYKKFSPKDYKFNKLTQTMSRRNTRNKIMQYNWDAVHGKLELAYPDGETISVAIKNSQNLQNLAIDPKTGAMSLTTPTVSNGCEEMVAGSFTLGQYADLFNVTVEGSSRNTIVHDFDIACDPKSKKPFLRKQNLPVNNAMVGLKENLKTMPQTTIQQNQTGANQESTQRNKRETVLESILEDNIYPSAPKNYMQIAENVVQTMDDYMYFANPHDNFKYLVRNSRHGDWIERSSQLPVLVVAFHLLGEWENIPIPLFNRLKVGNYIDSQGKQYDQVTRLVEMDEFNVSVEYCRLTEWPQAKHGDYPAGISDSQSTAEILIATFLNQAVLLDYTVVQITTNSESEPSHQFTSQTDSTFFNASKLFHYSQHHSIDYVPSVLRMEHEPVTNKYIVAKYHCGNYHHTRSFILDDHEIL